MIEIECSDPSTGETCGAAHLHDTMLVVRRCKGRRQLLSAKRRIEIQARQKRRECTVSDQALLPQARIVVFETCDDVRWTVATIHSSWMHDLVAGNTCILDGQHVIVRHDADRTVAACSGEKTEGAGSAPVVADRRSDHQPSRRHGWSRLPR